jgi:hypothetical protein
MNKINKTLFGIVFAGSVLYLANEAYGKKPQKNYNPPLNHNRELNQLNQDLSLLLMSGMMHTNDPKVNHDLRTVGQRGFMYSLYTDSYLRSKENTQKYKSNKGQTKKPYRR